MSTKSNVFLNLQDFNQLIVSFPEFEFPSESKQSKLERQIREIKLKQLELSKKIKDRSYFDPFILDHTRESEWMNAGDSFFELFTTKSSSDLLKEAIAVREKIQSHFPLIMPDEAAKDLIAIEFIIAQLSAEIHAECFVPILDSLNKQLQIWKSELKEIIARKFESIRTRIIRIVLKIISSESIDEESAFEVSETLQMSFQFYINSHYDKRRQKTIHPYTR
jgi:hypothetical protein